MKELSIEEKEEKVKRYDEALALMQDCIPDENGLVHVRPEEIFPELKESEGERIRKALITYFSDEDESYDGIPYPNILAWLEKQVQKPQGKSALEAANKERVDNANKVEPKDYSSIDPHFFKPAWSEEDDVAVKDICDKLNRLSMTYVGNESIVCQEEIKWLKSLSPQPHWKPSDEQMDMLKIAVSTSNSIVLDSLYNDLEKLKG